MPAKTRPPTGFEATCLATADHFIACRGSKPASRIRARFDCVSACNFDPYGGVIGVQF